MKKRLIALLVITPLLLSSQIYASNAAAKAGAKCSKLGSKSVVGSKTFTCIKSGNKLIWNKGNAKSTNTSNFAERWNATGSMAIKTMTKAFPAKSPSFPKVELTWRYSDTVNSKIKEEITKQYEHNIEFWSAYTKFDAPLQVIVGTLDDIQFVCKWRSSYLQINAGNCETSFRTDKQRVWDAHTTQANGKGAVAVHALLQVAVALGVARGKVDRAAGLREDVRHQVVDQQGDVRPDVVVVDRGRGVELVLPAPREVRLLVGGVAGRVEVVAGKAGVAPDDGGAGDVVEERVARESGDA